MQHRTLSLRPLNALLKQLSHSRTLRRTALGLGAFAPAIALANPTGGQVVAGNASISATDPNHTVIDQASQSAILNWQQFSIGSNQYVQFIQPDSSAVVLNRVVGGDPSQILGNLSANGQVFLVNPNGVFFGQGASLDVQGLVATTLDIKNSDFMAGHYVFAKSDGAPDAGVVNQGTLTTNNGYIVLAGDYAENDGVIAAQAGQVVLASGNQVALTLSNNALVSFVVDQATLAQYAGVSNTGTIEADGGTVLMTAKVANALTATAVNNSGLITAHSIQDHNGTIILAAQGGDIEDSGTLDASATQSGVAGGYIRIRGNAHTDIASTASINAAGDDARGGFVELSGHDLSVYGNVNPGDGGTLLIDPVKLYLTTGATLNQGSITSGDYVNASFIKTKLDGNTNVYLIASSSVVAGNPGAPGATGPATNITASGTGNLTIKTGTTQIHSLGSAGDSLKHCVLGVCNGLSFGASSTYGFTATNGTINLSGLTINIKGAFTANAGSGNVTLAGVTAQKITVNGGSITTGALDATGALASQGITLHASHASYGGPATITTGALTTTAGNIIITQNHGMGYNGNSGGNITIGGAVTAGGALTIAATEGTNGSSQGGNVTLNGAATAKSISITATAKGGADINTQNLHANGLATTDNVSLVANANGGASSSGGNINVSGGVTADHGGVTLNARGGLDSGGKISVSGNIQAAGQVGLNASNVGSCCGEIQTGNITGGGVHVSLTQAGSGASGISVGALTATGAGSVSVQMYGGGSVTVNGAIKAGGGVNLYDAGPGTHAGLTVTGNVTAGSNVSIYESGAIVGANTLKTGSITAGAGVNINIYQNSGPAKVTIGNINAGGTVGVSDTVNSAGSANLTLGNVSGTQLLINAHAGSGQNATIQTGALTAKNTTARGLVSVTAHGKNNSITTGAVTAQGVLMPSFSGHPSIEHAFFRDAANVTFATSGSGNNAVTVNGGITLKGTAGHYMYSGASGNSYIASGSTGQAILTIKNSGGHNTVNVTGAITANGAGFAGVEISADKVTLGGDVSLTATAVKMKQSGTLAISSPQHIVYNESGTKLGAAELFIHDTSGASIGGAIKLKGPSARVYISGNGGITTRGISITGTGEKFTHKATGTDSAGKPVNYSSTESAGGAVLFLQAGTPSNQKAVKVQGAIGVTGIGRAVVGLQGGTIATQAISVTEAAGKYARTGAVPYGPFASSIGGPNQLALDSSQQSFGGAGNHGGLFRIEQGTLNGGIAGVQLQAVTSSTSCGCNTPATSITVGGDITVSAVGEGEVSIVGQTVNITGGITGTATRATANGKGSHYSYSGGSHYYDVAHTVNGSGGRMHVDIRGKQNGTSSGSSNNYTGTVTIGGAINLTGPTASVRVKSGSIKTGNISVNGTGENISITDVYTPSGSGAAFTLKRSGVIDWTGIDLEGKAGTGKVTTGNLLAEGPLFAAIHIGAGTVTVGNLGVIASSGNVTLVDTRISTTPLTFTAGDAGIAISALSGTGSAPVFGPATVNGNINIEATRDVHLLTNAAVSGYVLVTAGRNIDDPLPTDIKRFINQGPHNNGSSSNDVSSLKLSASALALLAGGNITLNDAVLKVGTGSVPGVVGDSVGIDLLATQGLASTGMLPNATFVAGGSLGLGQFTLTGDYLYMEAGTYSLTGPISVPTSTIVQFAPVSLAGSIGVEPGTSTSSQLNLSGALLNLFPGTTLLVGGTNTSGAVTIGTQGTITLAGDSNFLVDTTGTVTGLEKIITSGLVGNLIELVNFQVPTASEIQTSNNSTGNDSTDQDKKKKKNANTGEGEGGDNGGTIEQDDDPSGVCHG